MANAAGSPRERARARDEVAPEGWPNHVAIPGARTYEKHNGSPPCRTTRRVKAGVRGVAGGEGMLRELDGSVRYLSIREAALVQGFPQDYEFPGIRSRVMGVIGNAVAVGVAAKVGESLMAIRRAEASVESTLHPVIVTPQQRRATSDTREVVLNGARAAS